MMRNPGRDAIAQSMMMQPIPGLNQGPLMGRRPPLMTQQLTPIQPDAFTGITPEGMPALGAGSAYQQASLGGGDPLLQRPKNQFSNQFPTDL